jgi:hypothetical protein
VIPLHPIVKQAPSLIPTTDCIDRWYQLSFALKRRARAYARLAFAALAAGAIRRLGTSQSLVPLVLVPLPAIHVEHLAGDPACLV